MTPPGKSAALRRLAEDSTAERIASETTVRQAGTARTAARSPDAASEKLLAFPAAPGGRAARPAPANPAAGRDLAGRDLAERDLAAELESALMNDLESMVAQFDQAAREPEAPPAPLPVDPDQQALDRLLASIRQTDSAPSRAAGLQPDEAEPVIAHAVIDAAPMPKARPNSPRPSGRSDRMAPPSARVPKARPQKAGRPEPQPALQLAMTAPRRNDRRLVIVGAAAALVLFAGIGAVMTVRALTARGDAAVASAENPAPAPAAVAAAEPAKTPAPAPAKVEDQAPASLVEEAPAARPAVSNAAAALIADPADAPQATAPIPSAAKPAPATMAAVVTAPLAVEPAAESTEADTDSAGADAAPTAESPAPPKPQPAAEAPPPAAASGSGRPSGTARIASGVKLRSNPDNGAPVLGMLGAGTTVQVISCKGWCEVVAGDKRGFVFQKFLTKG